MKKLKIKISTTVTAILALCLFPVSSASAVTPMIGHKYINGVGNVPVWVHTADGVGYWQTYINGGVNNWMYTGWSNPIYMTFVSSNYGSMMDFHLSHDSYYPKGDVSYANTELYRADSTQIFNPWPDNWAFAEIRINNDKFTLPSFSNAAAQGTVRHEMGHAFGLNHWPNNNYNQYSIMAEYIKGRAVQSVQLTDNDSINIIY